MFTFEVPAIVAFAYIDMVALTTADLTMSQWVVHLLGKHNDSVGWEPHHPLGNHNGSVWWEPHHSWENKMILWCVPHIPWENTMILCGGRRTALGGTPSWQNITQRFENAFLLCQSQKRSKE